MEKRGRNMKEISVVEEVGKNGGKKKNNTDGEI
jgi:hypothetical protein